MCKIGICLFNVKLFILDKEVNEVFIVDDLLLLDWNDYLDLFLEFLQMGQEFSTLFDKLID
jgi:hypothetical protein